MGKWIAKRKRYQLLIGIAAIMFFVCTLLGYAAAKSGKGSDPDAYLTDIELLGKYVFFDKISNPPRMACVTCHDPATGGTGSVSGVKLHQVAITGANPHTIGNLKPPTNAYATFIEDFDDCNTGGLGGDNVCGGNFWDGRAEGNEVALGVSTKHIGDEIFYETDSTPLGGDVSSYANYFGATADQALNPMPPPNFVEQNIERQAVCEHVKASKYAELYEQVWGVEIDCSDDPVTIEASDVDQESAFDISFKRLMLAVCAWQHSKDLNSFSSKRDKALRAELACACAEFEEGDEEYPGEDVCDEVGYYYNPSVCSDSDYTESPGLFPLVGLTEQENYGHDLFYAIRPPFGPTLSNGKFSNCAFCHSDNPLVPGPGPKDTGDELFQLYSADDYHNIGTPRNPEIPVTFDEDSNPIDRDLGVAGHMLGLPPGFHKTPTLRNVNKRKGEGFIKAYTHNGWFKSMESIVHFYNTAFIGNCVLEPGVEDCTDPGEVAYEETTAFTFGITRCPDGIVTEKDALANNCWPAPAYGLDDGGPSAIPFLVGDLHLTADDEAAIVAYLKTLTDEHTARAPKPYKP